MIRAAALALALAVPAGAQDLSGLAVLMDGPETPEQGLAAAYAACLAGDGETEPTAEHFARMGWMRQDQPDMGTVEFWSDDPNFWAMVWDGEGGFCMVSDETIGTETARNTLEGVSAAAGYGLTPTQPDSMCPLFELKPGLVAELTSSGQDPVCDDPMNSAVRFTWSAGQG